MPYSQNFLELLNNDSAQRVAKLQCYLHFFERFDTRPPTGSLVFSRHPLTKIACEMPFVSDKPLRKIQVEEKGVIDDADPSLYAHVDFANEFIGGGVLFGGCVQEEIRFAVAPLCTVSLLFFPRMLPNESIKLLGCGTYCKWRGYGFGFRFAGDHTGATGAGIAEIIAMDAVDYDIDEQQQFSESHMRRDIIKAFAGFNAADRPKIATGNWGCGAFGGNMHLKSLLQWLAASAAGKDLRYYSFGEGGLWFKEELQALSIAAAAKGVTCSQLWSALLTLSKSKDNYKQPREMVKRILGIHNARPPTPPPRRHRSSQTLLSDCSVHNL
jgi:poly(ADP-ribose) glycohydrolase